MPADYDRSKNANNESRNYSATQGHIYKGEITPGRGQENEFCVQIDMNLHIWLNSEYDGKVKQKKE